jgi:hypothetical protein
MKKLSPKQKKIAAMAGNKGKIDAADFAALRASKQGKAAAEKNKPQIKKAVSEAKAKKYGAPRKRGM